MAQQTTISDMDTLRVSISNLEQRKLFLNQELRHVDRQLKAHNAELSRLVNEHSLIYKLPDDILTYIFLIIQERQKSARRPPPKGSPFHIILSQVSHRWRNAVHSTPLLWNQISLEIRPMNHFQGRCLAQLEAQLLRSNTCFLDIVLRFLITDPLIPYFRLLSNHSSRWRRLSIAVRCDQNALALDDILALLLSPSVPSLEHLSLSLGKPQDGYLSPRRPYNTVFPTTFTQGVPRLSFLRLAGMALGNLHPPTSAISTLHLDGWTRNYMTHEQFISLFRSAPALVNLSLSQLTIHHPRDPLEIVNPVELPHLKCLRIRGTCSPFYRLISLLKLPNLESLSLCNVDTFDSDIFPHVKYLSLDSCSFDEPEISNLFVSLPSITHLDVDQAIPDIFFMLIPTDTESTLPVANPWPQLNTMVVRKLENQDVSIFLNMVLSRRNTPLSEVGLDRRSRSVLKGKRRLEDLQRRVRVEDRDNIPVWPTGLGYEDVHDEILE